MFAIQNIKTGKFLFGTDFRYNPYHQRTSDNQMLTYSYLAMAKSDYLHRKCSPDYRIVCLKPVEVNTVIPLDSEHTYELNVEDWRTTYV